MAQQIIDVQAEYYKNHKGDKKNTITRWNRMVVNKFITMAIQFWKNRCELVHKKDKSIIESYARTSANDLCKKLLNTVWFLPSASRHLLERDEDFFRSSNFRERHVQFGIQEMECTETRGATDICTWMNFDSVNVPDLNEATKKRCD